MTAAMARQLAPLKSQTVRCDAWQQVSASCGAHPLSTRRRRLDSSLSVRYHRDVHLKALRKEEWLREHSFEVESEGVIGEPQAKPTIGGGRYESYQKELVRPDQ